MAEKTPATNPITETLSFKADSHLHNIEEALRAIGVLMGCIAQRGDPDKSLISPVYTIIEDTDDELRDLRKLIEGGGASPGEAKRSPDKIRQLVQNIETPIIEADECYATMCKLIDYVEDPKLKSIMGRVSMDNSSACLDIRRLYNELHGAVYGNA